METKIKTVDATLIKEQKKYYLKINTKVEQKIDLSSEDQSYLPDVFSEIISELLENPFKIKYVENSEDAGMNDACKKFVEILNTELASILKDAEVNLIKEEATTNDKSISSNKKEN